MFVYVCLVPRPMHLRHLCVHWNLGIYVRMYVNIRAGVGIEPSHHSL